MEEGPSAARDIALFTISHPGHVRPDMGVWMAGRSDEAQVVLRHFAQNVPITSDLLISLRTLCRIVTPPTSVLLLEPFLHVYCEAWYKRIEQYVFEDANAVFVLAYNIFIHDMDYNADYPPDTFLSFKRQLTGANAGNDFDAEMLQRIYNDIDRKPLFTKRIQREKRGYCGIQ